MQKLRVLMLAGGSGGHFFPLVAVGEKLQEMAGAQGVELVLKFLGDAGSYADYLKAHGIVVSYNPASKLRRYASALNVLDFFKFFWGLFLAIIKLYFFMPDVVFSKSGPGTLPIIFAARWYRIPVVIHESDAVPGVSNTIASKHAAVIELSFEHAKKYFEKRNAKVRVVGSPVRSEVIATASAAECRRQLGIPAEKPVLFIIGGSQGAQVLNEFVVMNAQSLLNQFEIVHQVGEQNMAEFTKEFEFVTKLMDAPLKARYKSFGFLTDAEMATAFGAADIVLSRSGSFVFEIAANGKPALLVPIAESANNHQRENAYAYSQSGAAVVIEEDNLLPGIVMSQMDKIIDTPEIAQKMSAAARAFYKPDAPERIAADIMAVASGAPLAA